MPVYLLMAGEYSGKSDENKCFPIYFPVCFDWASRGVESAS